MPCTPIAVSAWRTSSSLNGLMMATTSFMSSPPVSAIGRSVTHLAIWHLSGQLAQKSCKVKGLFWPVGKSALYRAPLGPPQWSGGRASPAGQNHGGSDGRAILVLCGGRAAAGPPQRNPTALPDRPRHGDIRHAGLERRYGSLAKGRRGARAVIGRRDAAGVSGIWRHHSNNRGLRWRERAFGGFRDL